MNIRDRACSWLEGNLRSISLTSPATIHVDDLTDRRMTSAPTSEVVDLALQAFCGLLDAPSLDLATFMPIVVVSVEPRASLQLVALSWDGLAVSSLAEPPPIYVVDRRTMQLPNQAEEYRCVVAPPSGLIVEAKLHSYYRCYREPLLEQFECSLYLEAYPKDCSYLKDC